MKAYRPVKGFGKRAIHGLKDGKPYDYIPMECSQEENLETP